MTTITISREQHALATERVREAGLAHLVDVQLRDYRDISGAYDDRLDRDARGRRGGVPRDVLRDLRSGAAPGGRLSLITFPDAAYEQQLRGANWIQTYIFPGGLCPSLAVLERATSRTRLLVRSVTDIAPSYVLTLRSWRERFMARTDAVRALGFDDRFIRMWEYYLALSEAGFATGISQDLQIVFEKGAASARAQPFVTGARAVLLVEQVLAIHRGERIVAGAQVAAGSAATRPLSGAHSHVRNRLSRRRPVRSRWIGVTAIRRFTTAWKSVPSTASPDGGGPPIQ